MLHRSTSSQRCRPSRNMTNLGYASSIAGPRGRRASVATDKPVDLPQASPRGTMERQRSPQGSFVPDIGFDVEHDDEGMNHRLPLDRDQYGGSRNMLNQKFSRSPRNSLLPDDYYKPPRNGARSPRNSLVPETGLGPDGLYSSRHSLVEPPLSPRNSLVPDIARNRSPRNSLVPPTGSRSSLLSENGNPLPSRSPRHSLVPNSTRSPRGSITNMELVDRSPQRSPRGSIASEYMNQSPRGSIAPYEMNRSSRGSIGIGDVPRGSIGGNDEEMTRSPRRSIDPDAIDRTPRGSLSGLQERRSTKASLMAQDPRRASADQGMNDNRNSPPSRKKEVSSGSMKSGGSTVHINQGYGPTTFEDSRRGSSSVSQFSGDESRRLFTSSAKVLENTMENRSLGVKYGSVVYQLKDANQNASNICDFIFRALRVVCRTRVVIVCLIFLSAVPFLMLIYGWNFFKECPKEPSIPTYMVIGGTFGMMLMILVIYSQIRSRRLEMLTVPSTGPQISFTKLIIIVLSCFLICWFAMGNYWILHIMWPLYKSPLHDPDDYCSKELYLFSLVHLGVVYIILGITLFVVTVLASFKILACPLPERYR